MEERIALGSGKIYLAERPDSLDTDLADLDAMIAKYCVPQYEFGAVKNGATLSYSPTNYTASDDLGRYTKTIVQEEAVTLGCGLITVGADMLNALVDTARVEETTSKKKVIKIGGTANAKNATYLVVFEHLDSRDGNIYVIIAGKNTAELQFAFQPGTETILNPTFTAEGLDDDGTKLIIVMDKPKGATEA